MRANVLLVLIMLLIIGACYGEPPPEDERNYVEFELNNIDARAFFNAVRVWMYVAHDLVKEMSNGEAMPGWFSARWKDNERGTFEVAGDKYTMAAVRQIIEGVDELFAGQTANAMIEVSCKVVAPKHPELLLSCEPASVIFDVPAGSVELPSSAVRPKGFAPAGLQSAEGRIAAVNTRPDLLAAKAAIESSLVLRGSDTVLSGTSTFGSFITKHGKSEYEMPFYITPILGANRQMTVMVSLPRLEPTVEGDRPRKVVHQTLQYTTGGYTSVAVGLVTVSPPGLSRSPIYVYLIQVIPVRVRN